MRAKDLQGAQMVIDGNIMPLYPCKDGRLSHVTYLTRLRRQLAKDGVSLDGVILGAKSAWVGHQTPEQARRFDRACMRNERENESRLYNIDGLFEVRETQAEKVKMPEDAMRIMHREIAGMDREHFMVLTLDGAHAVIDSHITSIGTLNKTILHPRDVFRAAIKDNAAAVILAHNHPSGHTNPSKEDREGTERMVKAGRLLGINVLDHVIVTRYGYHSFAEHGDI